MSKAIKLDLNKLLSNKKRQEVFKRFKTSVCRTKSRKVNEIVHHAMEYATKTEYWRERKYNFKKKEFKEAATLLRDIADVIEKGHTTVRKAGGSIKLKKTTMKQFNTTTLSDIEVETKVKEEIEDLMKRAL